MTDPYGRAGRCGRASEPRFDPARRLNAAVVVTHPDEETLWAGGIMLLHPRWNWNVVSLGFTQSAYTCARFHWAMNRLNARGRLAGQNHTEKSFDLPAISEAIRLSLPAEPLDLLLTYAPSLDADEQSWSSLAARAVVDLWTQGQVSCRSLWTFAYQLAGSCDEEVRTAPDADVRLMLPEYAWKGKQRIITELYGMREDSVEARTAPREEAFWCFSSPEDLAAVNLPLNENLRVDLQLCPR